jgi:hypothetical protein
MMGIKPWFDSGFSWPHVQGVWSSWQTFNAGMTAFTASIIALYVVGYKERAERERKQVAANALMPIALSEIIGFCECNFKLLQDAYSKRNITQSKYNNSKLYIEGEVAEISTWVSEALKECIASSEKKDGKFIAGLLSDLQVMRSRLQSIHNKINSKSELLVNEHTIERHVIELAYIVAKINRLFPFARMKKRLYTGKAFKKEVINALCCIGCDDLEFVSVFEKVNTDKDLSEQVPDCYL